MKLIIIWLLIFSNMAWAKINKKRQLSLYGKLGVIGFVQDNDLSIENSGSRFGIYAQKILPNKFLAYAMGEWSFNAVDNTSDISIGEDNNFVSQSDSDATFGRRLGYIGFDLKQYGDIRIGKSWSVYSDVSHYTDNFNLFGGSAGGTYNVNTDGGQSGTGRVSKGFIYRNNWNGFYLGLQAKLIRNKKVVVNDVDQPIIAKDGYGISIRQEFWDSFEIGVAYTQLELDGDEGSPNGYGGGNSWSSVFGFKYKGDKLTVAMIYNRSKDHELSDENVIFDGEGQEVYIKYTLGQDYQLKTGYNHLADYDEDLEDSEYKKEYYILGLSYHGIKDMKFFVEARANQSTSTDGELGDNSGGFGVSFKF